MSLGTKPIYISHIQSLGIKSTITVYTQLLVMKPTSAVYNHSSSTKFSYIVQILPLAINLLVMITTIYTGHVSLVDLLLAMTIPSINYGKKLPKFLLDSLQIITLTSNSYRKKLLNLAKIYTNNTKYSNCNDSFIFKLAIFHNIYSKTDVSKTKMKTFSIMLKNPALDNYFSNFSISGIIINFN